MVIVLKLLWGAARIPETHKILCQDTPVFYSAGSLTARREFKVSLWRNLRALPTMKILPPSWWACWWCCWDHLDEVEQWRYSWVCWWHFLSKQFWPSLLPSWLWQLWDHNHIHDIDVINLMMFVMITMEVLNGSRRRKSWSPVGNIKVADEHSAPKVNRDLVSPAFELLAGDLAVAMEVINMAVALGEFALISKLSRIWFQLFWI